MHLIIGLLKNFGTNPFPWWDYDDARIRLISDSFLSTFGNRNHLAGYMEMAIPLVLGLLMTGYRGGGLFLLLYLTFIMFTALALSLSRGGWIGAAIGLSFMAVALITNRYFKRKVLLTAFIGGALALTFVVLSSTPIVERIRTFEEAENVPSFQGRVETWGGVIDMIQAHPLIGAGPGTFATVFTQYVPPGSASRFFYAHNDYLHFISEVGISLVGIMIWMIIALYGKGFKKLKDPSRMVRGITLGAMSGITAILIHSISDFNLNIPANALLFTILAALVVSPVPTDNLR